MEEVKLIEACDWGMVWSLALKSNFNPLICPKTRHLTKPIGTPT